MGVARLSGYCGPAPGFLCGPQPFQLLSAAAILLYVPGYVPDPSGLPPIDAGLF